MVKKHILRKKQQTQTRPTINRSDEEITNRLRAEIRAWKEQKGREMQALRETVFAEMRMLGLR